MENFINLISDIDIKTISIIWFWFWYFTRKLKTEIRLEINQTRQEITDVRLNNQYQIQRLDTQIQESVSRLDAQIQENTKRSDRLYQMFIDLLKEKKS